MDVYASHLVSLNANHAVTAHEDICNAQGLKLLARGSRMDEATLTKLAVQKLLKPLGESVGIAGELDSAVEQFAAAVDSQPAYAPARFELARLRMRRGELGPAMSDFRLLAHANKDAHSMAYLGYCFNLTKVAAGAIEWYELAIRNGAKSAAVYNNLGASYLDAPTRMRYMQQLPVAEDYLLKALELDPTSITIQLNIVRYAEIRAKLDPLFNPATVWRYAQAVVQDADNSPLVQFEVAGWYETVLRWEIEHVSDAEFDESARRVFAALHRKIGPRNQHGSPNESHPPLITDSNASSTAAGYLLEPLSLNAARP